jgi:hypothetical protein
MLVCVSDAKTPFKNKKNNKNMRIIKNDDGTCLLMSNFK